jgi:hypothetical protein
VVRPERPTLHPVFAMASLGLVLLSFAGRPCSLSSFAETITLVLVLIIWLFYGRRVRG